MGFGTIAASLLQEFGHQGLDRHARRQLALCQHLAQPRGRLVRAEPLPEQLLHGLLQAGTDPLIRRRGRLP
eukprot:15556-Eustigmatos_ZCMA.PRE.1